MTARDEREDGALTPQLIHSTINYRGVTFSPATQRENRV